MGGWVKSVKWGVDEEEGNGAGGGGGARYEMYTHAREGWEGWGRACARAERLCDAANRRLLLLLLQAASIHVRVGVAGLGCRCCFTGGWQGGWGGAAVAAAGMVFRLLLVLLLRLLLLRRGPGLPPARGKQLGAELQQGVHPGLQARGVGFGDVIALAHQPRPRGPRLWLAGLVGGLLSLAPRLGCL